MTYACLSVHVAYVELYSFSDSLPHVYGRIAP